MITPAHLKTIRRLACPLLKSLVIGLLTDPRFIDLVVDHGRKFMWKNDTTSGPGVFGGSVGMPHDK